MNNKDSIKNIIVNIINVAKSYEENQTDEDINNIVNIYKNHNLNVTERNYFDISNFIDEQIAGFIHNRKERQEVQEYILEISDKLTNVGKREFEETVFNNFRKFIDFIAKYVKNHITIYSSMLIGIEKTEEVQKNYAKQLEEASDTLSKTKDTIDNLLPNLLTVLSILISIVIAVVIVYITIFLDNGSSIENFKNNFLQLNLAKYALSAHVVGNLFFLMMFMIARLTNRSILMTCSHFDWKPNISEDKRDRYETDFHRFACADCKVDCSFFNKLQRKSAYIIYFNVVMVVLYAFLYIWWLFEYYITNKNEFLFSADFYLIVIVIVSIILFFIIRNIKKTVVKRKRAEILNELKELNHNINFNFYVDKPLSANSKKVVFYNNLKRKCRTKNNSYQHLKKEIKNTSYKSIEYKWSKDGKNHIFNYSFIET